MAVWMAGCSLFELPWSIYVGKIVIVIDKSSPFIQVSAFGSGLMHWLGNMTNWWLFFHKLYYTSIGRREYYIAKESLWVWISSLCLSINWCFFFEKLYYYLSKEYYIAKESPRVWISPLCVSISIRLFFKKKSLS